MINMVFVNIKQMKTGFSFIKSLTTIIVLLLNHFYTIFACNYDFEEYFCGPGKNRLINRYL